MGPSPHLWFLDAKQRLLDQNNKSLWFPDFICGLCMQKQRDYPSESLVTMGPSPHLWFWAFKTATVGPKLHVSMGPRPHLWFSTCKTACLASELLVSMSPRPYLWFLCIQNSALRTRHTSLYGSQTSSVDLSTHNSVLSTRIKEYIVFSPHLWFSACKTATSGPE